MHYRSYQGRGFYGSKEPTNSAKALREDRVLRIRLKNTKYTHTNTNEMVPV